MRGKKGWACVRISPGCVRCYAARQNEQCGTNPTRAGTGLDYIVSSLSVVEVYLDEKTLLQPLRWKRGRLIFPCSMTDWQADFVPDEFRDRMLAVMAATPQHTYLSLTKRADRQRQYLIDPKLWGRVIAWTRTANLYRAQVVAESAHQQMLERVPLKNLWLGVSAENQQYWDERVEYLRATPAALRWVSAEPLLGPIKAPTQLRTVWRTPPCVKHARYELECLDCKGMQRIQIPGVDWLVVGGESGPKARPMHPEWARSLRDRCQGARIPFFFKQWGGVDKKAAGRLLDGREWSEYPETTGGL